MRLTKSDPTGSYSYLADGISPASDVLTDGHSTFTPGISEVNGLGSRFYPPDAQGNSRGLLDSSQTAQDGYNWDGFGNLVSRFGSNPTGFAWNVSSGYQSDNDSGLRLLGHRYYDSRTGRFISQDPAGDGDNWYAYADNDPMDGVDPDGLFMQMPATGETMAHDAMMGFLGGLSFGGSGMGGDGSFTKTDSTYTRTQLRKLDWGWGPWELTDEQSTTFDMGGSMMIAGGPAVGDNLGNFIQAIAPHAPKQAVTAAAIAANLAAARGAAAGASAALKHYVKKKAAAGAWKLMGTATARGLARSLGVEAIGAVGVAGLGIAAEGIAAGSAGYEFGTVIANAPLGPGGQTVTDYWTDQMSNSGLWLQQHTTFGH